MEINNDHVIPMMVDDSHVIPMMVEDVTKPKVKPKRQSKTKLVTGEVKVAVDGGTAADTDFELPHERKWNNVGELQDDIIPFLDDGSTPGMSVEYDESGNMLNVRFSEEVAMGVQATQLINSVAYTEVRYDGGVKVLVDPVPAFNGAAYTIQNITTPDGQDRKIYYIDLAELKPEVAESYMKNVVKLMGKLATEPNQNKRVYHIDVGDIGEQSELDAYIETIKTNMTTAEISHADIFRAAYYAERAEMQAAHLDSPAFDTSIKTPLVK